MNANHAKLALFVVQQEIKRVRAFNPTDPTNNPLYCQLVGTAASLRHEVKVAVEKENS